MMTSTPPVVLLFCLLAGARALAVLRTTSGTLTGVSRDSVTMYLGVPYAAAPVGDRRFQPPVDFASSNPRLAQSFGDSCVQPGHAVDVMHPQLTQREATKVTSEDCLTLNLFVPAVPENCSCDPLRPVMIWIPGEGFNYADASQFDASQMAAQGNVVVVTVNYRVGVFGFLSMGTEDAPGNVGIQDVLSALRWVKRNARAIGGDARRITIFGRFSGSMIVSTLLTSPAAKGLFQRAILQSGVATGPYIVEKEPEKAVKSLAHRLGCPLDDTLLPCLKSVDTQTLLQESQFVAQQWRPVLDGVVVPRDPLEAAKGKKAHEDVEVLIGENRGDGSLCYLTHYFLNSSHHGKIANDTLDEEDFQDLIRDHLRDYLKVDEPALIGAAVHEYHYARPSEYSFRDQYLNFCRHMYTGWSTEAFARSLASQGLKVFRYEFATRPGQSRQPDFLGAAFGDEVPFVFGFLQSGDEKELDLQDSIVKYWTSFAAHGDPNGQVSVNAEEWPQFVPETWSYLVLSKDDLGVKSSSETRSRDHHFWTEVIPSILGGQRSSRRTPCSLLGDVQGAKEDSVEFPHAEHLLLGLSAATLVLILFTVASIFCLFRISQRTK